MMLAGAHGAGSHPGTAHLWGIALGVVGALALAANVAALAVVRYHMQYRSKVCQASSNNKLTNIFLCHQHLTVTKAVYPIQLDAGCSENKRSASRCCWRMAEARAAQTTRAAQQGACRGWPAAATAPLWGRGWGRPAAPLRVKLPALCRPACCAKLQGEFWPAVRVACVYLTHLDRHSNLMPNVSSPLPAIISLNCVRKSSAGTEVWRAAPALRGVELLT